MSMLKLINFKGSIVSGLLNYLGYNPECLIDFQHSTFTVLASHGFSYKKYIISCNFNKDNLWQLIATNKLLQEEIANNTVDALVSYSIVDNSFIIKYNPIISDTVHYFSKSEIVSSIDKDTIKTVSLSIDEAIKQLLHKDANWEISYFGEVPQLLQVLIDKKFITYEEQGDV